MSASQNRPAPQAPAVPAAVPAQAGPGVAVTGPATSSATLMPPTGQNEAGSAAGLGQVSAALALVLLVVVAAGWLMRRFYQPARSQLGGLRVIGNVAVGTRERVVVVELDDTWLVVGVAPGRVNALHSMPRGTPAQPSSARPQSFAQWLTTMSERRREGNSP